MITAATQALADFLVDSLAWIGEDQISFCHPKVSQGGNPSVNLYCYHIEPEGAALEAPHTAALSINSPLSRGVAVSRNSWLELSFLISVFGYTSLGEQHILSEVLNLLSNHQFIPEQSLSPSLKGRGSLPVAVASQSLNDTVLLWNVLDAPLRPALQVTLVIPPLQRQPALSHFPA